MPQTKLLLLFTLLAGIGLGAWARDAIQSEPEIALIDSANSLSPGTAGGQSQGVSDKSALAIIDDLREELRLAEQERTELREQLDALSARLSALDKQPDASEAATQSMSKQTAKRRRVAGGLTLESLTEAGISQRDASAIKSRLDELSMQRLFLRDQAQREGWLGKQEYRDEIRRINDAQNNLKNEFGSDNYSRYLYATGRPNQVNVQSVIENSPAYNAGLKTGDRLVSYDSQTVYDPRTIRQGTQRGTSGEMVPVVVLRDGQQVEFYVPRGPLGIQMNSESIRPPDRP